MIGRGLIGLGRVPVVALALGLAGLIPFLWAVAVLRFGVFSLPGLSAREVALAYGLMIYCFMAGSLWGFAAKGNWALGYALSVLPVLGFLAAMAAQALSVNEALIVGFAALLPLDWAFAVRGLAPRWWMRLRLMLSAVVIAALIAILTTG